MQLGHFISPGRGFVSPGNVENYTVEALLDKCFDRFKLILAHRGIVLEFILM